MGAEMLEPGCTHGVAVVTHNHEGCQLNDAGGFKRMCPQQRHDVPEDQFRLFRDGRRRAALFGDPKLPGNVDQLCSRGNNYRVAVKAKGCVDGAWIDELKGHRIVQQ